MKLDDDVVELRMNDALPVAPRTVREWEAGPDGQRDGQARATA